MKLNQLFICFVSLFLSLGTFAQNGVGPSIPKDVVLNTEQDYAAQKSLVIKSLSWLISTPLEEHVDKRNELNAFVLLWLSGSPSLTLNIESKSMPFLEENEDLLFTFMHGMALYQLHHPKEKDKIKLHAEGLIAVARIVKMSKVKKDGNLKKLLKAYRKDCVYGYAEEKLKN